MKNWLKVIFRRRLRGLIVVQERNIVRFKNDQSHAEHAQAFKQYCKDQGLAVLFVRDVNQIKAIGLDNILGGYHELPERENPV